MSKEKLITGIKVSQQMSRAKLILESQIIPREELFQIRKKKGKLGKPNILSRKPILQFDLQGNFIKEYDSYTSAKNTTKINGINNAVKGTVKTAGGYLWTYKTN